MANLNRMNCAAGPDKLINVQAPVIQDVEFRMTLQSRCALLGKNGAGKTTVRPQPSYSLSPFACPQLQKITLDEISSKCHVPL